MRALLAATTLMFATPALAGTVNTPVAATALRPGTILSEGDFETKPVDAAFIRGGVVTRMADLAGKQLKRSLAAGQPVRINDIKEPDLVNKGDLVTMLLERGGLALATTGKALDSGAAGTVVRIQNATSRIIVQGEVTGPNRVRVQRVSLGSAL